MALDSEIQSWKIFQKALDRDDKPGFEAMLNSSRVHGMAGSSALRLSVFETLAMSIVFDHYQKLVEIINEFEEVVKKREP